MPQDQSLRQTPLYEIHKKLGGKMVPFAGWTMPIQYPSGVMQEHLCVRNQAGLFDVSHMGEIDILGEEAEAFIQHLVTNDISQMVDGSVLYTLMCRNHGGIIDDLLVYRFTNRHYFFCVNASNSEKDFQWVSDQASSFNVKISDISNVTGQLALQGPNSEILLRALCDIDLGGLKYYHFEIGKIDRTECIISRTGYTGENGFEVYCDSTDIVAIYQKIMKTGEAFQIQPAGLAARDTLRLEMGYALYGQEINENSSPLEARLGWVVKLNKESFIGKEALVKQKKTGPTKVLIGIKLLGRGIARSHYKIFNKDRVIGKVTSGTYSPSLKTGIGMGYVEVNFASPGTKVQVEIRNQKVSAEVALPPFVPSRVRKDSIRSSTKRISPFKES